MITPREFNKMCKNHGFTQKKDGFFKLVGDGVYQVFFTCPSIYINTSSPWYSSTHRRSKYLMLGLWSIYSTYDEDFFVPEFAKGEIEPENLIGERGVPFMGIQEHYRIMQEVGFDFLSAVDSQPKLLTAIKKLCEAQQVDCLLDESMVIPCLLCGEEDLAKDIIRRKVGGEYAMEWYKSVYPGDPKAEMKERGYQNYLELKKVSESRELLAEVAERNKRTNLARIREYGIPTGTGDGTVSHLNRHN